MSKNLELLLKNLGVEDVQSTMDSLLSDEENSAAIDDVLRQAQSYSKPFIETELNGKFADERKSFKGKYFKDALNKVNKSFGNVLTSKEIDDILNDAKNEGNNYDVAIESLREKVMSKSGISENELRQMVDKLNSENEDLKNKIPEIEKKAKEDALREIENFKLDGVMSTKLVEILQGKTSLDPIKAANLLKGQITKRARLKLKEDGNIALYDLLNGELPLKKNETQLQTFEGLVNDLVDEFGIKKESPGVKPVQKLPTPQQQPPQKDNSATLLAAKLAQVTTA